ncbi:hypothetical protein NUITMVRA1_13050 [Aerococcus viridans]|uniref:hypothetical protein n=1 Tax=Aerococcus viridans TaxID=1377 RepID=UPI0028FD904A|nr:hypothetical protein NUITMVRA1_13050 [Aerococcus viridans]
MRGTYDLDEMQWYPEEKELPTFEVQLTGTVKIDAEDEDEAKELASIYDVDRWEKEII